MKTKILACICISVNGIRIGLQNGSKFLENRFGIPELIYQDIYCNNIIKFRGGGNDSEDSFEESNSKDHSKTETKQELVDDVEIIPFDDDQFISSDETGPAEEDSQNIYDDDDDDDRFSSSIEEHLLPGPNKCLSKDTSLDNEQIENNPIDAPRDENGQNIYENSDREDQLQEDKEAVTQHDTDSKSISTTLIGSFTHDDEVIDFQVESEAVTSLNQNDIEDNTDKAHDEVDESYILWRPEKPDAYNLKYKISLQLKRWAEKDELLENDDESKELRLLLHRRAQEYLRDLISFENKALTETSFKNIPQPKRVLHFIAPKIKAIKQSPYISLQIRGASNSDAKVAASTLAVVSCLTELYSIVKNNVEQNAGIFYEDSSDEVFGELLGDRRLQQVVECSLCGLESISAGSGRDPDSKLKSSEYSALGKINHTENKEQKAASVLDQNKMIRDCFPVSDATRIVFGLTALRYNSFANGTDVSAALNIFPSKAEDEFIARLQHAASGSTEDYCRQLGEDISEFTSVMSAATAHFNLQTKRVIKSCFHLLTVPLHRPTLPEESAEVQPSKSSPKPDFEVPSVLLDYVSTEELIKLVEASGLIFSSVEISGDLQVLTEKIHAIIKNELYLSNPHSFRQHEIKCVDAASLLDSAIETERMTESEDIQGDGYDETLDVGSFTALELSSVPLSKLSSDQVPESAKLAVSHEFLIQDINEHTEQSSIASSSVMVSEKPISFILRRKRNNTLVEHKSPDQSGGNDNFNDEKSMSHNLGLDDLCSFLKALGRSCPSVTEDILSLILSSEGKDIQSASDYELMNLVCVCCEYRDNMDNANEILLTCMEHILMRDIHESLDLVDLLRFIESISSIKDPVRFFMNLPNKSKLHLIFDRILRDMPENIPSLYKTVRFIRSYAKWRSWGSRGRRKIGWDRFETLGYLVQHCYDIIEKNENFGSASRRLNCAIVLSHAVALLGVEGSDIVHQTITLIEGDPHQLKEQKFEHIVGLLFAQAKYIQAIKCEENKETVDQLIKYACQSEQLRNLGPSDYALFIWSIGVLRDTSSETFDFQKSHNIPVFTRDQLRSLTPAMSIQLLEGSLRSLGWICLSSNTKVQNTIKNLLINAQHRRLDAPTSDLIKWCQQLQSLQEFCNVNTEVMEDVSKERETDFYISDEEVDDNEKDELVISSLFPRSNLLDISKLCSQIIDSVTSDLAQKLVHLEAHDMISLFELVNHRSFGEEVRSALCSEIERRSQEIDLCRDSIPYQGPAEKASSTLRRLLRKYSISKSSEPPDYERNPAPSSLNKCMEISMGAETFQGFYDRKASCMAFDIGRCKYFVKGEQFRFLSHQINRRMLY